MLTKAELINDIAYEMSGYLTSEGIDRLKTVITFKLVNINRVRQRVHYEAVHHRPHSNRQKVEHD